jgi:hypothetical protein
MVIIIKPLIYIVLVYTLFSSIIAATQNQAFAKIIYFGKTKIDTDKPLTPQINKMFLNVKANLSSTAYKSRIDTMQLALDNTTSRCGLMSGIFKGLGFTCDTQFALASVICQSTVAKRDILLCSDPFINEYLKSRNVTNVEGYARYALEHTSK